MVAVISNTKQKLMPTTSQRARRLLKQGSATIYKYRPFTIILTNRTSGDVQDIEYKCDTGYKHIGVSICSQKQEFVSCEFELLSDETEKAYSKEMLKALVPETVKAWRK